MGQRPSMQTSKRGHASDGDSSGPPSGEQPHGRTAVVASGDFADGGEWEENAPCLVSLR
jgi:hypothetical protein